MKPHTSGLLLQIAFISMLLMGCLQGKQKETDNSDNALKISTQIIDEYTLQQYSSLEERSHQLTYAIYSKPWLAVADKIQSLTASAHASVDSCFENPEKSNSDKSRSNAIGIITKYKLALLGIDTMFDPEFEKELSTIIDSNYLKGINSPHFDNGLKDQIHNSIAVVANRAVSLCNARGGPGCILRFEEFSALVGQNAIHFKTGDKLEITAGIGSFSVAANPTVTVNDEKIHTNRDGCAVFKKTVTGKPGEYSIPVTINFTGPDGSKRKKTFKVKYFID